VEKKSDRAIAVERVLLFNQVCFLVWFADQAQKRVGTMGRRSRQK